MSMNFMKKEWKEIKNSFSLSLQNVSLPEQIICLYPESPSSEMYFMYIWCIRDKGVLSLIWLFLYSSHTVLLIQLL